MASDPFILSHLFAGAAALLFYWGALLARKGTVRHRAAGRTALVLLAVVAASVGPLLLLDARPFDPGRVVQFVYLSLCLVTVSLLAWTAIRFKDRPERFRALHLRILGPLLFALGAVVLAAGLAKGDPVAAVLSWVGLAYGAAMMRFAWMRAPLHPKWWMSWHLNATCGLFTAVHGTMLFVMWSWAVASDAGRNTAAAFHVGVLLAAIGLRAWYGRRRGVPWGFARDAAQDARVRVA